MSPFARSLFCSAALHVAAIGAVVVAILRAPAPVPEAKEAPGVNVPPQLLHLVFIAAPGPGGGGGGGGNRQPAPIRRAEGVGRDAMTLRVQRPVLAIERPAPPVEPLVPVVLDAKPIASGAVEQAGLPTGGVPSSLSLGPGSGGGVGEGVGSGIGSGRGPGVGPGVGGGIGGGVYRAGGGVSAPQLLVQVRPNYTPDALARRIQGTVELEAVVTRAGVATQLKVRRSLDSGLDYEAVKAVQQWRFAPGRLGQTPVDVWVTIFVDFTIR